MFINSFDEEEEKPGFTTPCEDIGLDDASLRAYLHKHREDILRCKDICLYLGYTADKTGEFDPVERESLSRRPSPSCMSSASSWR